MRKIRKRIQKWYGGEIVVMSEPGLFGIFTRYHWTAQKARQVVEFWQNEYRWIVATAIALVAVAVAILK